MTEIKCSAEWIAKPGQGVTAGDLARFAASLPPEALNDEIVAVMGDRGNQRDPWPYLRGPQGLVD